MILSFIPKNTNVCIVNSPLYNVYLMTLDNNTCLSTCMLVQEASYDNQFYDLHYFLAL